MKRFTVEVEVEVVASGGSKRVEQTALLGILGFGEAMASRSRRTEVP